MQDADLDWDSLWDSPDDESRPAVKGGRHKKDPVLDEADRRATQTLFRWLMVYLQPSMHAPQQRRRGKRQRQYVACMLDRIGQSNNDAYGNPDVELVNRRLNGKRPMPPERRWATAHGLVQIGALSIEDLDLLKLHAPDAVGRPFELMESHKERIDQLRTQLTRARANFEDAVRSIQKLMYGIDNQYPVVVDTATPARDLDLEAIRDWEIGRSERLDEVNERLMSALEVVTNLAYRHDSWTGVLPRIRRPEMTRRLRDRLRRELHYVGLPDDDDLP
ncbi:hypothetical protein [Burkholderia sp. TSV86]|uniref:hypothetical protein n=1 Tax=Burkholderia sp. TSV86 TaxID=1385594 RepID=UPI0012E37A15|nr:hypothetical protein [Burkholderia sp. TSV86]